MLEIETKKNNKWREVFFMKESEKLRQELNRARLRKQSLLKEEKAVERKIRTHELVEIGAIVEKYLGERNKYKTEALCILTLKNNQNMKNKIDEVALKLQEKAAQPIP